MSFPLLRANPINIVVHAVSHGQQIINSFTYRSQNPAGVSTLSSSASFLTSFRSAFRANFLFQAYPDYVVYRYWLRVIIGATLIPDTDPAQYRPAFGPFEDFLAGAPGTDFGQRPLASQYLPEFVAMNMRRIHVLMGRRFFQSSIRVSPFAEEDQGATPNEFDAATLTRWNTAMDIFAFTALNDGEPPGNEWFHCTFSPTYYGRTIPPLLSLREATNPVTNYVGNKNVTSQNSRKVRLPAGA